MEGKRCWDVGKILLVGIFLVALILILFIYFEFSVTIFKRYLGFYNLSPFVFSFIPVFLVLMIVLFANLEKKKFPQFWFVLTICLMGFIASSGFLIVESVVKNNSHLVLWEGSDIVGSVLCYSSDGPPKLNSDINCEIEPSLVEYDYKKVILNGGFSNNETILFKGNGFRSPSYLPESVYFEFRGIDDNQNKREFTVFSDRPFFVSEDEAKEIRKEFYAYLLGLFAVVFVTVPIAVNNLKKLWDSPKHS